MDTPAEQEQAIRVLREAYAAFNRGDIAAAVEPLDPHIEWTEPAEFPGGGTYSGHAGVTTYLTQSRAAWAECTSEPEHCIRAVDRMVMEHDNFAPLPPQRGQPLAWYGLPTSTPSGMAKR